MSVIFSAFIFSVPNHYKLAMHIFGLLACSTTLKEMDEVILSATVLFCSPCTGDNVSKHYSNLQVLMQQMGTFEVEEEKIVAEDYKVIPKILLLFIVHTVDRIQGFHGL